MPARLAGKVAIITGAASGMGAASARLFASEGAHVLLADIDSAGGLGVVNQIEKLGGVASFFLADVTDEASIAGMIGAACERYGGIDIIFNNAGGPVDVQGDGKTHIENLTAEDWDRCYALNTRSAFLAIKYALPELRRRGGGSIVCTGSGAGVNPPRGGDAYNSAKAAVHNLVHGLAQSIAEDNIRINGIIPGWTATRMLLERVSRDFYENGLPFAQPIRRAGQPEDIANAALFLASDEASFITGALLPVDGGALVQKGATAAASKK